MSRTYATPLILDVQRSRLVGYYFLITILLAALSILLLPANIWLILFLLLALGLFYFYQRENISPPVRLIWNEQNEWLIQTKGNEFVGVIQKSSFISVRLTVLNFKLDNKKHFSVVIAQDNLHKDLFRQLRVRLKIEKKPWSRAKIKA